MSRFRLAIDSFKPKYIGLMLIYFANSFAAFNGIGEVFWIKNSLNLSNEQLIAISIWINLPWTMKIFMSQFVEGVKIFGSQRKSYLVIGAFIMLAGHLIIILLAHKSRILLGYNDYYFWLILSGAFTQVAIVLQDLIADTLCYELVDRVDANGNPLKEEAISHEIGMIQLYARLSDVAGVFLAAFVGGLVASRYSYADISLMLPLVTIITLAGAASLCCNNNCETIPINKKILAVAISYISAVLFFGAIHFTFSLECIFVIGCAITIGVIRYILRDTDPIRKNEIFAMLIVLFAFRMIPSYGPALEWWKIDELGFDPEFFGHLNQISVILGLIGVWIIGKKLIDFHIGYALLILNTIHAVLQLPLIAMTFGLHEWTMENFGFGAKSIILMDITAEGPFSKLGFMILCIAITIYAPKKYVVTWFAVANSLMSLAYVTGGRILNKYLAQIFVIERGSYENVKGLMITTCLIDFLLPTIAILIFMNPFKKKTGELAAEVR